MAESYILALDQGTTSSRALVFDRKGQIAGSAQQPLVLAWPQPGWVEVDAEQIWQTQWEAANEAIAAAGITPDQIAAIGIANQRETTVVWERASGRPIGPAIVWQCRRTAPMCEALIQAGQREAIRCRTGLEVDAYFSATKIRWLLDQEPDRLERARRGELLFGTVDSWLVWKLTGGAVHATDLTNASRTLLVNLAQADWDPELLDLFGVPAAMLPEIRPSADFYGNTARGVFGLAEIPIRGVIGDQQGALFGQGCLEPGMAKNTYGTGCFLLMQTGSRRISSQHGLLTTPAWQIGDRISWALEGSVFMAGAILQWLRDELGLIEHAADSERLARSVPDTGGVCLVPAFTGLGAPYWDMQARGTLVGLTRGSGKAQIVRAGLEAIAFQTYDVLEAMSRDAGQRLDILQADGGAAANDFLLQFQADLLGVPVRRPQSLETTAFGAAGLAGLAAGFWPSESAVAALAASGQVFTPALEAGQAEVWLRTWRRAVDCARGWAASSN